MSLRQRIKPTPDERDALLWCLCVFGGVGLAVGFLIAFAIWGM